MSDDRPDVYLDPELDAWVYRASAAGNCVRALVATALSYDSVRSDHMTGLLERTAREGDLHEDDMRKQLEAEGHVFSDVQTEVLVPVVKGSVYLRGHVDGVIESGPRLRDGVPAVWEAKSLSTYQWDKWMAKGKDGEPKRFTTNLRKAGQIATYMEAFPGHDALYQSKRRDDGTIDTFLFSEPPVPFRAIKKKILIAESYRRRGELPGCDIPENLRWGCDFFYLHDEEVLASDEVDEEVLAALGELVTEYDRLRSIEQAGKAAEETRKKELNPEMVSLVGAHPYIEVGGFRVSVVSYDSTYTDWKAVEAEADPEMKALIARHTRATKVTYPKVGKAKGMGK